MSFFQAENIVKQYSNHLALDQVSINVPEGSIYGLLGPNGAGKTTLIRIINQITAPDQGKLYMNGKKMRPDDIYQIGYLPEERGLYKKMKVGEQALYLAQLKGVNKKEALKRLKYWFEKFEIQSWWDKKVEELSKGMQQKIQFITTILHEPKLLIFDEPFSGFDPINTKQLKQEILTQQKQGATIIFSTHNMESVEELCDHITLINNARCMLEGSVNQIKDTYKPNIFDIEFSGNYNDLISGIDGKFEIIETNNNQEKAHQLSVKINPKESPNILVKEIIKHGELHLFSERLPKMNEIFIEVVQQKEKN